MIRLTLAEAAEATGGRLTGADPAAVVTGPVTVDSRLLVAGGLFVALPGEHHDGHDFVPDALTAGAVAVVVTRPVEGPHLLVADAEQALGALAAAVLARRPDLRVVALTGSSGKTGTKDLVAGLLERVAPTVAPPGSFNNEVGLPLTVLSVDEATQFLVLEMGARGVGHIAHLARLAPPSVGVVLNVGSAHLGEFGSREAIAAAKSELVQALPPAEAGGVAVLNADDPLVAAMAAATAARVVTFGESTGADVRAEDVRLDPQGRARFRLATDDGQAEVALRLVGQHQVSNALAAAAVATVCGLPVPDVAAALAEATPRSRWRMEVVQRPDGVTVVNDAYNANPESVRAALKALVAMAGERRTWAVLGEMRELGDQAVAEHDAIGRLAVRLDVDRLVVVGEAARPMHLGASLEGSWADESVWVPDVDAAVALLHDELAPGDVVLVKASRAAGLERVAEALLADADRTEEPR